MPTAEVNGVKLHYEDIGSGEPIVLVHGAASAGKMFDPLASVLEDSYRLIIPDLRGMGSSERVATLPHDAWVRDLGALLDVVGLRRAHLLGGSLGARIVARYALEEPDRVTSVIVDAPIIAMEPDSNRALNTYLSDVEDDSPTAQNWRQLHGDDWREVVETYFRVRNDGRLQEYLSVRSEVASTEVPTLITRGDFDEPVHPLAHCFEWHRLVARSWLYIAPGTGPSAAIERPKEFKTVLDRFLADRVEPH